MTARRISNTANSLYFVNASTDILLMGGFSLLLFVTFFSVNVLFPGVTTTKQILSIAAMCLWLFNWPHFAATGFRLYHSPQNRSQYPMTAYVIPFIILSGVIAAVASPTHIAPYFIKLYLVWSPYHYSGQTYGISMLYAKRSGAVLGSLERRTLSGFIYGTFLAQIAFFESKTNSFRFFDIAYPALGLPDWIPQMLLVGMYLSGAVFLILMAQKALRKEKLPAFIFFVPAAAQFVWFVWGRKAPGYFEFIPLFHSLQYLLIAWMMQLNDDLSSGAKKPSLSFVSLSTLRWSAFVFGLGVFLFWGLPRIGAALGRPLPLMEPIIISAINIHHFFVDGVIWKLKNSKVGTPLMAHLSRFTGTGGLS